MENNMKDIFDLEEIEDLPWLLRKEVDLPWVRKQRPHTRDLIKEVFSIEPSLTLNQITVGIFRRFGFWRKREECAIALDWMVYVGRVENKKALHLFVWRG